jgi:hypothetical protein
MAPLRRTLAGAAFALATAAALGWVASCSKLVGFGGPAVPLAQIHVQVTGDFAAVQAPWTQGDTPHLRVALVWGAQRMPEPLCILPPESAAATTVLQAGCPDIFGFVPDRVGADVAVTPGTPATLDLMTLPSADVMVGDVTARVAYGSLYVYDDRNGNGTLDLHEPPRRHDEHENPTLTADAGIVPTDDIVYGASFISMTLPDQRVAYREGTFNAAVAFYPRAGCPDPPPRFSILGAGGFSRETAIAAALQGQLPPEDPASCTEGTLDATTITITLQAPDPIKQLACAVDSSGGGTTRYRAPPAESPDLANLPWACVGLPRLPGDDGGMGGGGMGDGGMGDGDGGAAADVVQLIIAGPPGAPCRSLTHYTLRGCDSDPLCETPVWDFTTPKSPPPAWWPCAGSP